MELSNELLKDIVDKINLDCTTVDDVKFTINDLALKLEVLDMELQNIHSLKDVKAKLKSHV